ncbi:MAG: hypothetical protein GY870_19800 [archaeon]|nr:hypothetical protein [archaeon]
MEVKVDYENELISTEKKKIKWLVEEFDQQFEPKTKKSNKFSGTQKKMGNEFLNYVLEIVDVTNPEVLEYFQSNLQKIENKYPILFK